MNMAYQRPTISRDKAVSQRSAGTDMGQDGDQAVTCADRECNHMLRGLAEPTVYSRYTGGVRYFPPGRSPLLRWRNIIV